MEPKKPVKSEILKSGAKTYFFDVLLSVKNEKYLKITESQYFGPDKENKRNQIIVFAQTVKDFKKILDQIVEGEFK